MEANKAAFFVALIAMNAVIWYEAVGMYTFIITPVIILVVILILSRGRKK